MAAMCVLLAEASVADRVACRWRLRLRLALGEAEGERLLETAALVRDDTRPEEARRAAEASEERSAHGQLVGEHVLFGPVPWLSLPEWNRYSFTAAKGRKSRDEPDLRRPTEPLETGDTFRQPAGAGSDRQGLSLGGNTLSFSRLSGVSSGDVRGDEQAGGRWPWKGTITPLVDRQAEMLEETLTWLAVGPGTAEDSSPPEEKAGIPVELPVQVQVPGALSLADVVEYTRHFLLLGDFDRLDRREPEDCWRRGLDWKEAWNSCEGLVLWNSREGLVLWDSCEGLVLWNSCEGLAFRNSHEGLALWNSRDGLVLWNSREGLVLRNSREGLGLRNSREGLGLRNPLEELVL